MLGAYQVPGTRYVPYHITRKMVTLLGRISEPVFSLKTRGVHTTKTVVERSRSRPDDPHRRVASASSLQYCTACCPGFGREKYSLKFIPRRVIVLLLSCLVCRTVYISYVYIKIGILYIKYHPIGVHVFSVELLVHMIKEYPHLTPVCRHMWYIVWNCLFT